MTTLTRYQIGRLVRECDRDALGMNVAILSSELIVLVSMCEKYAQDVEGISLAELLTPSEPAF